MAKQTRVGIAGFTGYSGAELLGILKRHPLVEPVLLEHRPVAASELPYGEATQRIPFDPALFAKEEIEIVFLATSLEVSMESAPKVLEVGIRCIDLSAAFRLRTIQNYKRWYRVDHSCPELLSEAVYGLPEHFRELIKISRLVANPGCYPTAVNLCLRPLISEAVIDRSAGIICDAKSGVSGAGRSPSLKTHFCEVTENLSAYSVLEHRHVPEVLFTSDIPEEELSFTAQLLPVHRGILETIYFRTDKSISWNDLQEVYKKYYQNEPFIRLYPEGRLPDLVGVCHTNYCDIGVRMDPASRRVVIVTAIDNLVKGAAGQAVQNMNLLLGCDETTALLNDVPVQPEQN